MLGSLIIYLKGMRRMMFQLSGFYYKFLSLNHEIPHTKHTSCAPQARCRNGILKALQALRGPGLRALGFRVWGLGVRVQRLGFGV